MPRVLDWARGGDAAPWATALLARAAAHRANALRAAGDHPAAERIFIDLRRQLAAQPPRRPAAVAEITRLEAALRLDQERLDEAEELFGRAALAYRYARDASRPRPRPRRAVPLLRHAGRAAECLLPLDDAARGFAAVSARAGSPDLFLRLSVATERINALCDLERFTDARRLLARHADDYEASEEPYSATFYRALDGRIALGTGDLDRAEQAFPSARDAYLTLDRNHAAALACLYLAEVYLALGRFEDLQALAGQLVPQFRSRQLPAETLKAFDLLTRAVYAKRLTAAVLAKIRREVAGSKGFPAQLHRYR